MPAAALRGVACPDPNPEVALVLPDAAETYTFGVLAGVTIPEPRRVDGGGPGRSSEVLRTEYILDGNEIGGFGKKKINKGTEVDRKWARPFPLKGKHKLPFVLILMELVQHAKKRLKKTLV